MSVKVAAETSANAGSWSGRRGLTRHRGKPRLHARDTVKSLRKLEFRRTRTYREVTPDHGPLVAVW
jgi:hypothetical protein